MFPLNSNTPYIKDTGERARLGQIVGSDTPELPDYDIADAGKVLTVGEDGSLEWDEKGAGGGESFLSYDFTKVGNRTGVRYVNFSSDGATFTSSNAYIPLSINMKDITLYVDVTAFNAQSDRNNRFIMGDTSNGLIYRSTGLWGFYTQNTWNMSQISDPTIFDNSKIKVYIDEQGYWHIYANNELIYEPTNPLSSFELMIGSSSDSIRSVIRGARVYNGNYTE